MKRIILLLLINANFSVHSFTQTVLANWTFETSIPTNSGPHAAEIGTGSASGFHTSGTTAYSNPTGNGSAESFSSDNWASSDYYQFEFPTTGYSGISIIWDATGSNTGPRDFKVTYSIDGINFNSPTNNTYSLSNDSWSSSSYKPISTRNLDLSSYTELDNTTIVYIRLVCNSSSSINGGTIATGGTSRVDNFKVNAAIALPIVLYDFKISKYNDLIKISFSSAYETNSSHFIIEWSRDAKEWNEIGTVKAGGTTHDIKEYTFIHENPKAGINYYRLTQVDFDGRKETFPVKSVYFGSNQRNFDIIPNLAFNNVKIEFEKPVENGRLHIYNIDGQLMQSYVLASGIDVLRIDVSELPSGQYIAKYIDGEDTINRKFIKQ